MPLIDIWKIGQLSDKRLQQILGLAGNGQLKDGNPTSGEFRDFLSHVPSENIFQFTQECLDNPFPDSGLALQDIVNQLGRRLGFAVEPGLYRGGRNKNGFDGLWQTKQGEAIVVEVKTTDAYRLSLDDAAGYRNQFIRDGKISEHNSSILYVVGRDDTGDLEAQVRGSRHAWDIRIISIGALIRLVEIKEELAAPETIDRIRDILMPREYTRVDGIIDLVFSATNDPKDVDSPEADPEEPSTSTTNAPGKKFTPVKFRDACIPRLEKRFNDTLVRQSLALFATPDEKLAVLCPISREYDSEAESGGYWFAVHVSQRKILSEYDVAWICFGCGSAENLILVPLKAFDSWDPFLNKTESNNRDYWHVQIYRKGRDWELYAKGGQDNLPITQYLLP